MIYDTEYIARFERSPLLQNIILIFLTAGLGDRMVFSDGSLLLRNLQAAAK